MSKFIEDSKHPFGTSEVESHFSSNNAPYKSGVGAWKKAAPYGSPAWNTPNPPTASEQGLQNTAPVNAGGNSLWNASRPALPRESGVNYTPATEAGHKVLDDPFSGDADGMPGDSRQLWRK